MTNSAPLVKHAYFQTRAVADAFATACKREGKAAIRLVLVDQGKYSVRGHEVLWADSSEALLHGQL